MATNALSTVTTPTGITVNDRAREIAQRVKFMIQNGRKLEDQEVYALAQYCAANDLNPFAGEAYYMPGAGPVPGIAGWRKKAQEQLNWEAENQKELGAHFWCDVREATTEEAKHDPNRGDIAMFVTLHDWLSNKRWRRAFFETVRELKEIGYSLEDANAQAKIMVGPEPVWTGVGTVYAEEIFGKGEKFNRAERAAKRAEKIALRKRFPRVSLPEPASAEHDAYDGEWVEADPAPRKSEAELLGDLGYDAQPAPKQPAAPVTVSVSTVNPATAAHLEAFTGEAMPEQTVTMTLDDALVLTRDGGQKYGEIDNETLSHMANSLTKTLKSQTMSAEERATRERKLAGIKIILAHRAQQ